MISGGFHAGHPRLTLTLDGAAGPLSVEFVVDPGFEGGLTLPARLARQLGGSYLVAVDRMLANGSLVKAPVYEVTVSWEGEDRFSEVLILEGNPLVGTEFLADHLLTVEIPEGGEVTLEPL